MNWSRLILGQAVLVLSGFLVLMVSFSCEDTYYEEEGDWDELAIAKSKSGCEGKCSPSCQCNWTEVGCETDNDCSSGLRCEIRPQLGNRCLKKKDGDDQSKNDGDKGGDCHEFKPGHGKYCSDDCKCKEGEGDCDKDSHCLSGLTCKQQDGTDFCVSAGGVGKDDDDGDCHEFNPGHGKYCSDSCKCEEGEGDCDKDSHCKSGLVCVQQDGTDFCEKAGSNNQDDDDDDAPDVGSAKSNLQVRLGGVWKGVCCNGGELEVSGANCKWKEGGRVLTTKDVRSGGSTALYCPENNQRPADCRCRLPGERMHGINVNGSVAVSNSLRKSNGAPIYPNSGHETCVDLVGGELQSRWESSSCPNWRLTNFY